MKKCASIFLFVLLLSSTATVFAQSNKKITGLVTDTSKTPIADANISLISGKDTVYSTTDADGFYQFNKIKSETFSITIKITGYDSYTGNYAFGKEKSLKIKTIQLNTSANMLKEVVIKTKPNPIRIMQDTVEYNAAAYQVLEGDNVADLLKQFPGLEIDGAYNVKTMGKEMVKLRVNGKDFFTNNVKDFIAQLPAAIVSKIQIIDDFGDEANFTGIKVGEPVKMLNIVTKPGMNKGIFGSISANSGTNDQLGSNANMSLWKGDQQSSGSIRYGTSNNGAGINQNMGLNANSSNKMGKNGHLSVGYNFGRNNAAFTSEQAVETLNPLGTFYSNSANNGQNENNNHRFNSNFSFNNKKIYMNGAISVSLIDANNFNSSFNNQSGVIRQDQKNINSSSQKSPNFNTNVTFSKILKNKKNNFSANFGLTKSTSMSNQDINTNILYYDQDTQLLKKDSLLNRNLITENNTQTVNIGFNFSLGLKKPKDTLARQSLNFNYVGALTNGENQISTFVLNNQNNQPNYIDSLSSSYTSLVISQSLGINYNYNSSKMRYNLGFNVKPNLMRNHYRNLQQTVNNNTLNYSPTITLSKTISPRKIVTLNYNGLNNAPSLYQLQPIRNTQNLQNIVIGNPNLKSSFNHNLSSNFNYVHTKSGFSAQTGINFSTIQNEIVNNIVLVPDTLNSLKQETRFENVNGNYNVRGNYNFNFPLKKNKYSIFYSGSLGFSNRAVFINNNKSFNKGVTFNQNLGANLRLKKFSLVANTNYTFSSNNNSSDLNLLNNVALINIGQVSGATFFKTYSYGASLNSSLRLTNFSVATDVNYTANTNRAESNLQNIGNISSLNLSLSAQATLKKTYQIGFNATKRVNTGYTLANTNPLILNANLRKSFFKDRSLSLTINANDLLNQGNNLSRYISGNSIIDSRTNQITRVFTFGLSYNISNFGGKGIRVDPD